MPDSMQSDRPVMPEGYGLLDSSEGAGLLEWAAVEQQLTAARNYWIATSGPDGRPHCVPVWGVWVDDAFYFGTDDDSRKARNLHINPQAVVHLESGDEAVILEGTVERVGDAAVITRVSRRYAAKYDLPQGLESPLMLRPQVAFAWRERDFPGSATRWRFTTQR